MNRNISLKCFYDNTKVLHLRDLLKNMEETIGDRLRRLRKSAKLTQAELASKVGLGQSAKLRSVGSYVQKAQNNACIVVSINAEYKHRNFWSL